MQNAVAGIGSNFPAIELPPPRFDDLAPLRDAFRLRRTEQRFSQRALEAQTLSDLLWAARGVHQSPPEDLSPVADASASNAQEIDVYISMEQGLYLYDPERARLAPVLIGDLRRFAAAPWLTRSGDKAPARLIYVVDVDRLGKPHATCAPSIADPEAVKAYCYVDCGIVAANVYLFAAAAGLNAWFHECDRPALAKRLPLRAGRRVLFAQTVGYPR
ncbi:MAG TPA: nitroreductase family protein [Roseiarcus sp.]|nr:nitroreductase family protein [Roseiarcus sp.]